MTQLHARTHNGQGEVGSDPRSCRRQPSCVSTRPPSPRQTHWISHILIYMLLPESGANQCERHRLHMSPRRHHPITSRLLVPSSSSPFRGVAVFANLRRNRRSQFARQLAAQSSSPTTGFFSLLHDWLASPVMSRLRKFRPPNYCLLHCQIFGLL